MVSNLTEEFRSFSDNCSHLRPVFLDARKSLQDVSSAKLFSDGKAPLNFKTILDCGYGSGVGGGDLTPNIIFTDDDLRDYSFPTSSLQNLDRIINGQPALVIIGQTCIAKANLVNAILEQLVLPTCGGAWRWVRIAHGPIRQVSLIIGSDFELVEKLQSHLEPWKTIPIEDLIRPESEKQLVEPSTLLEVRICHRLLEENVQLVVPPDSDSFESHRLTEILQKGLDDIMPVFLYSMESDRLSEQNLEELRVLKALFPLSPVFFIYLGANGCTWALTACTQRPDSGCQTQASFRSLVITDHKNAKPQLLANQLVSLGYMSMEDRDTTLDKKLCSNGQSLVSNELHNGIDKLQHVASFVQFSLQTELLSATTTLNEVISRLVRKCVLCAFDMAREIQITPRRIQYAQEREEELYKSLVAIADENQEEISDLIEKTLEEMKESLVETTCPSGLQDCQCKHEMELESESRTEVDSIVEVDHRAEGDSKTKSDYPIESNLQSVVDSHIVVDCQTSEDSREEVDSRAPVDSQAEVERAIRQQVLARLSAAVGARLAQRSGDCVAEGRVGTLRRCVASLELAGGPADSGGDASGAVQQILMAAHDVDLGGGNGAGAGGRSLLDRVVSALRRAAATLVPAPRRDVHWRRQAAFAAMRALPPPRPLAAFAHARARSSLAASHAAFQQSLARLADRLASRLEQTHEQRLAIRKQHAPRLARLLLETTCMADKISHGMPRLGKEIGRGQYGVVFSCDSWAGAGPCAVKTVVPPDDKHWNDLAMEFYYTRTIPPHDRIVRLRGSVLDHLYGGGEPAVLLVMDRLKRDLYSGLRSGLTWLARLQVAIDVVQGIRYLHSQGLVHRDIKLKNVLLDDENRAKLTDLGFCIPEAMMSGSIVGTPVHMAPELLSGHYDSSVDVYAFGILFWYICAGHVKLPYVFERFQNKEQLWVSVKRGIRPERLHQFDDRCWALMVQCWAGEPTQRPLLGDVQPLLEAINAEYKDREQEPV